MEQRQEASRTKREKNSDSEVILALGKGCNMLLMSANFSKTHFCSCLDMPCSSVIDHAYIMRLVYVKLTLCMLYLQLEYKWLGVLNRNTREQIYKTSPVLTHRAAHQEQQRSHFPGKESQVCWPTQSFWSQDALEPPHWVSSPSQKMLCINSIVKCITFVCRLVQQQ